MRPFFILLFSLFALTVFAGNSQLSGKVLDRNSQDALEGAVVRLEESGQIAITNALGIFHFSGLEPGAYSLQIDYLGYAPQRLSVELVEMATLEVALEPTQLQLPQVEVRSQASYTDQLLSTIDWQLRPVEQAQDLLPIVPGLFIAQHAGGGKAEQLFLRGFDLDHGTDIAISVDGIPVNLVSHAHGQGYADLHFLLPELIENVDYGKGAYAPDKGNLATAGYVDFQTKKDLSESQIKFEAGQFDTYRVFGMLDLLESQEDEDAYVAAAYRGTQGYFDSPQDFQQLNVAGNYQRRFARDQQLRLNINHFNAEWDASGQIPVRAIQQGMIGRFGAIDDTEGGITSRTNAQLSWIQPFMQNGLWKNQLYYARNEFELYSNFTFFANDPINGDQIRQKEERDLLGLNSQFSGTYQLWNQRIRWEAGLESRLDIVENVELSRTRDRQLTLERLAFGDILESNTALYTSQRIDFGRRWQLEAGLRFDHFYFQYDNHLEAGGELLSNQKTILNPKLNLSFQAFQNTSIYLKTGTGFHSNDARVVTTDPGIPTLPRALGLDFGTFIKATEKLLINFAVWQLRLEQEFVYVGDEAVIEPGGETHRQGIDLSLRYQLLPSLMLDTDVTWSHARALGEPNGEDYIPLAPMLTASGGLQFQAFEGLRSGLRFRYLQDRPANEDFSQVAEGYFLLDWQSNYRWRNWELNFSVQNLLNTEWKEAQFSTTSRLQGEPEAVSEIHFTPGTPFFLKGGLSYFF